MNAIMDLIGARLLAMPEKNRAVYLLRRVDNMPMAQIALVLAIPPETAQQLLAETLETLAHDPEIRQAIDREAAAT